MIIGFDMELLHCKDFRGSGRDAGIVECGEKEMEGGLIVDIVALC